MLAFWASASRTNSLRASRSVFDFQGMLHLSVLNHGTRGSVELRGASNDGCAIKPISGGQTGILDVGLWARRRQLTAQQWSVPGHARKNSGGAYRVRFSNRPF